MNTEELLTALDAAGVRLWVEDGTLRYRAPQALDARYLESLRQQRDGIIERISAADEVAPRAAPTASAVPAMPQQVAMLQGYPRMQLPENLHVVTTVRIRGLPGEDLLERSLQAVVSRHATLRTRFAMTDSGLTAISDDSILPTLRRIDLRDRSPAEQPGALHRELRLAVEERFDIYTSAAPHFRLIRLAESDHILIMVFHHALFDGWSDVVFGKELRAFIAAELSGEPPLLEPLPLKFQDFATWRAENARSRAMERHRLFWRRKLANPERANWNPAPLSDPPPMRHDPATRVSVPAETTAALRRFAQRYRTTPSVVFQAAFAAALAATTGLPEVMMSTTQAGRGRLEFQNLIGPCFDLWISRMAVHPDASLADLVRDTIETRHEAAPHLDLVHREQFEILTTQLGGSARRPVMFNYLTPEIIHANGTEGEPIRVGDIEFSRHDWYTPSIHFDPLTNLHLSVMATDRGDLLQWYIRYNPHLVSAETAASLSAKLSAELESLRTLL